MAHSADYTMFVTLIFKQYLMQYLTKYENSSLF
jgi:hypothetical protein